jgi:hypothetical protein
VLIYVHTRVGSHKLRNIMRQTWANRKTFPKVNVALVLGRSLNRTVNELIDVEARNYGDIILGDYTDVYLNLTFKALSWMRWIKYNCMNAKLLLKIDDDVVVNTFKVLEYANSGLLKLPPTSFLCWLLDNVPIVRDKNSPYYVSFDEYERDRRYFEPYCAAFFISNDLVPILYNLSHTGRDYRPSRRCLLGYFGRTGQDDEVLEREAACVRGLVMQELAF